MLDDIWLHDKSPILKQLPSNFKSAALLLYPFVQMPAGWEKTIRENSFQHIYPSDEEILTFGKSNNEGGNKMSMVTYIGLNFKAELQDEITENEVDIQYVFSEEENRETVKKKHFTAPYIYEIFEKGNPIWQMNDYQKKNSPHNYEKSKKTFFSLCDLLKKELPPGDFCEMYICWIGEEEEESEAKVTIDLNNLQLEHLNIDEKCFLRLQN